MSAPGDLRDLFLYGAWANVRLIDAAPTEGLDRVHHLLAHIVATEELYLDRARGADPWPQDFWPERGLDECRARAGAIGDAWLRWLDTQDEGSLGRPVAYRDSRGTPFETAPRAMIRHVALHGSYHRGQVAQLLAPLGPVPPTDHIAWTRVIVEEA